MTVTITCQYTGIEFEADSKRTKNHPQVAKFLNEAASNRHQNGAGRQAKRILAEAKGQFDNIDDLMEYANAAYSAWCEDSSNQINVMSHKERIAADRKQMNAFFRSEEKETEVDHADIHGAKYADYIGSKK